MLVQAEISRSGRASTRVKAGSVAKAHLRYQPYDSDDDAEDGTRNPCCNYPRRAGPGACEQKNEKHLSRTDQGLDR